MTPIRNRRRWPSAAWAYPLAACVIAALTAWPMWRSSGIPSLQHDWAWPAIRSQMHAQALATLQPLNGENFGSINYYQFNAPFWLSADAVSAVFGTELGLRVFVTALLVIAAMSLYWLVRRHFAGTRASASAGAVLYVANAIVANRLAAGHISYLMCYALFPLIVTQLVRIGKPNALTAWLALVAIAPFATVHPQFLVFIVIAGAFIAAGMPGRSRIVVLAAAFVPLLLTAFVVIVALSGRPAADLNFERTTQGWEYANSSPMTDALELTGSVRNYDRNAASWLLQGRTIAMWALWALALLAAVRVRNLRPFFGLAAVGVLLHAGLRGPLAIPMTAAFERVEATSIFRELYHFAAFSALGLCICVGGGYRRGTQLLASLVLVAVAPQLSGSYFRDVTFLHDQTDLSTIAGIVGSDTVPGYVAFLPMLQPMGPDPAHAGVDPDAFAFATRSTIHAFLPVAPLVQIDVALRRHPEAASEILRSYGVRYVVLRPDWNSMFERNLESKLVELSSTHPPLEQRLDVVARSLHVVWRSKQHLLAKIEDPAAFVHGPPLTALGRLPVTATASSETVTVTDPRDGWADALRWFWWSDALSGVSNPGLISVGRVPLKFDPHPGTRLWASSSGSASIIGSTTTRAIRSARFEAHNVPTRSFSVLPTAGIALVGGLGTVPEPTATSPPNCARIIPEDGSRWRISVSRGCPFASVEVLTNRSTGWRMHDAGGEIFPDASRWDAQYHIGPRGAVLDNSLLDDLRWLELIQYGAWALSVLAATMLAARMLVTARQRKRGPATAANDAAMS